MSNNILIIVKFNDNFEKFIPISMLLVPRTSLFLGIYLFINNNILKSNDCFSIKLTNNNNDISWFLPIGVYFDIIGGEYIELVCHKINNSDKYHIFDVPINKNTNLMIQQRLKHGLGTIFNSAKSFMDLNVQEVEKYIFFAISVNNDNYDNLEQNFYHILNKLYSKKNNLIRCPLVFHTNNKIEFYSPEINNEAQIKTLKEIIWNCGINMDILENSKNIIINGISLNGWMDIPIMWAIKNMCSSDLFIHVILKN